HGPPGVRFAHHIAFYPPCYTTYIADDAVSDRPIRLFHGTADEFAPIERCRAYVERLQRAGADVRLTAYTGAHHQFDLPTDARAPQSPGAECQSLPLGGALRGSHREPGFRPAVQPRRSLRAAGRNVWCRPGRLSRRARRRQGAARDVQLALIPAAKAGPGRDLG